MDPTFFLQNIRNANWDSQYLSSTGAVVDRCCCNKFLGKLVKWLRLDLIPYIRNLLPENDLLAATKEIKAKIVQYCRKARDLGTDGNTPDLAKAVAEKVNALITHINSSRTSNQIPQEALVDADALNDVSRFPEDATIVYLPGSVPGKLVPLMEKSTTGLEETSEKPIQDSSENTRGSDDTAEILEIETVPPSHQVNTVDDEDTLESLDEDDEEPTGVDERTVTEEAAPAASTAEEVSIEEKEPDHAVRRSTRDPERDKKIHAQAQRATPIRFGRKEPRADE